VEQRSGRCQERNAAPGFHHFTVPATADGLVIVADQSHLDIYGMLHD